MHTAKPPVSLLWPSPGNPRVRPQRLGDEAVADLELGSVAAALVGADAPSGRRSAREAFAMAGLRELVCEPEVIAYRLAVLTDLIEHPMLREQLVELLPSLEQLAQAPVGERYRPTAEPSLERVARRLADLELLVDVVGPPGWPARLRRRQLSRPA